jgi:hypothetical protein
MKSLITIEDRRCTSCSIYGWTLLIAGWIVVFAAGTCLDSRLQGMINRNQDVSGSDNDRTEGKRMIDTCICTKVRSYLADTCCVNWRCMGNNEVNNDRGTKMDFVAAHGWACRLIGKRQKYGQLADWNTWEMGNKIGDGCKNRYKGDMAHRRRHNLHKLSGHLWEGVSRDNADGNNGSVNNDWGTVVDFVHMAGLDRKKHECGRWATYGK